MLSAWTATTPVPYVNIGANVNFIPEAVSEVSKLFGKLDAFLLVEELKICYLKELFVKTVFPSVLVISTNILHMQLIKVVCRLYRLIKEQIF